MYKLIIDSCDGEVEILSQINLDSILNEKVNTFGKRYIPSLKIKEKGNPKARVEVELTDKFNFKGKFPHIKYYGKDMKDVLVLAEYQLERLRQERGRYSIHSSSVEKNKKGIILFGWKDSGKTSLALQLSLKYHFNFLSEGKTIIDENLTVIGCIHHLESDKEFIKRNFRVKNDLSNLQLSKEAKVSLFIYPQITFEKLKIENWNNEIGDFHLYENFSWKIRAANARINNFSYPLPSLDTYEIARKRSDFIKSLIQKVKVYHLRGSPNDLCKKIIELLE